MKTILLPTDFSDNSRNAVEYAIQLFKQEKCKFFLLNVYSPVMYDPEIFMLERSDYMLEEIYKKNSESKLARLIKKLEKSAGQNHSFEKIASFNLLIPAIKEIVAEKQIDMVIMGTKGSTGAHEVLWGSNTVHALKNLRCPLLIIPQNYSFKTPKKILLPTDYHFNYPLKILKLVKDLCRTNEARLHVLHVMTKEKMKDEIINNKKLLEGEIKSIPHEFHTIEGRSLVKAIMEFEKDYDIDMLVMVNNKHSFFRNLLFSSPVDKIGFRNANPFLVLPTGNFA